MNKYSYKDAALDLLSLVLTVCVSVPLAVLIGILWCLGQIYQKLRSK